MPNHVTTIVSATPAVLRRLVRTYTPDELQKIAVREQRFAEQLADRGHPYTPQVPDPDHLFVDFELLVPSPPNKETGGCTGQHESDVVCWYTWNVDHWGTKWNAYDSVVDLEAGTVRFDTAWAHPDPVLHALSLASPGEPIKVTYADEDLGSNVGAYTLLDGTVVDGGPLETGSSEAYELAAQTKYGMSYAELQEKWQAYTDDEEVPEPSPDLVDLMRAILDAVDPA